MSTPADGPYRAHVRALGEDAPPALPIATLMVSEVRGKGWTAALEMRPETSDEGRALASALDAGLAPGAGCAITLSRAGAPAREWAGTITCVATGAPRPGERDAHCTIGVSDPLQALAAQPIELGWGRCALAALLGAAVGAAGNADAAPGEHPVIAGAPALAFASEVRPSAATVAYAIACGEPLGRWLDALCAALAVRLEIESGGPGAVRVVARDAPASESGANRDGPLALKIATDAAPAPDTLVLEAGGLESAARARGVVVDDPERGDPAGRGPSGPIEAVLEGARRGAGERDGHRRLGRDAAAQVALEGVSCAPALRPGRTVALRRAGDDRRAEPTLFGASTWQASDIGHLYRGGHYVNHAALEKGAGAWYPPPAQRNGGPRVRTATVRAPEGGPGTPVAPDRLGRVPVRLATMETLAARADTEGAALLWLPARASSAGAVHGALAGRRDGDVCRIATEGPLRAEIVGFVHRDDRAIREGVRSASQADVMDQGESGWSGAGFGSVERAGDQGA